MNHIIKKGFEERMKHIILSDDIVYRDNEVILVNKSHDELFESNYIEKSTSWSVNLMNLNPGSRWITFRGRHILIKMNKDKTATVIFSPDPSMEHLRIVPKDHPEYADLLKNKREKKKTQLKKKKEKLEKQGKDTSDIDKVLEDKDVTSIDQLMQDEADFRKKKGQLLNEKRKEIKEELRSNLNSEYGVDLDKLGSSPDDEYFYDTNPLSEEERQIPKENRIDSVLKDINKEIHNVGLAKGAKNITDPKEKKKFKQEAKRQKQFIKDAIDESLKISCIQTLRNGLNNRLTGENDDNTILSKITTGIKQIDDRLKDIKLTEEQAKRILSHYQKAKSKGYQAGQFVNNEKNIDDIKNGNKVDWTKLNFNEDWQNPQDIITKEIKKVASKERAMLNLNFYNAISMYKNDMNKDRMIQGCFETADVICDNYLGGKIISQDMIRLMGMGNVAKVIAYNIRKTGDEKRIKRDLMNHMKDNASKTIMDALKNAENALNNAYDCDNMTDNGTLSNITGRIYVGKFFGQAADHLSTAAGSLSLVAAVIDNLKDKKIKDLSFRDGIDYNILKKKMAEGGLKEGTYFSERAHGGEGQHFDVTVPIEKTTKMLRDPMITKNEDAYRKINNIKKKKIVDGKEVDKFKDFHPKGMNDSAWDWNDADYMNDAVERGEATKTKDGYEMKGKPGQKGKIYEAYINKKGEHGYTSLKPEGTELYRNHIAHVELSPQQKRMVKFNMLQKRCVLDGKPGIGKTITIYSMISELKNKKKIKYGIFAPPSRLVDEAMKDAEKFFPNMKIGIIKSVSEGNERENAIEILKDAAKGKYDCVLIGQDVQKKFTSEITKHQPGYYAIDEAHEVFGSSADEANYTSRFLEAKKLIKNSEYVSLTTGTPIRNSMKELCVMASVLRPDLIQNPDKFANYYGKINQGTTIFQNELTNKFRKDLNEIMITEENNLPIKVHTDESLLSMTPKQAKRYGDIEKLYEQEKSMEGGYGLFDKDTMMPIMNKNKVKNFNKIPINFKPGIALKSHEKQKLNDWMKTQGIKSPNKYTLGELGYNGASARKDKRHYFNLHSGDINDNVKLIKLAERLDKHKDKKHIIMYTNDVAGEGVKNLLTQKYGAMLADTDSVGKVTGEIAVINSGISDNKKKKMINAFMSNPKVKYILTSPVAHTGINLQAGDIIHHMDRPNTYAVQSQRNGRAIRGGRDKYGNENYIYHYDTNSPYDQLRLSLVKKKEMVTNAVGNPDENVNIRKSAIRSMRHIKDANMRRKEIKSFLETNKNIYEKYNKVS